MTIRMDMKELIQCVIFVGWITICTSSGSTPPVRREHVCTNIDVRNKVESFAQLENCTVIEGFLKILLIDYAESSDYDHLHFPELREVTDYLLLYRVYGLRSLSRIFPNLSVIRGQKLFFNYALVAFEMPNLEDIALPNLTHIVRGAVRLEKNPNLCYIDTINWTKIARSITNDDNFILQNKDIDECVNVCPANENGDSSCRVPTPDGTGVTPPLCWNSDECQKVCPAECGNYACSFYPKVRCCHEECIGGCRGPKSSDCVACKKVFYNGRCMPRCPPGTYEYRQRRCITSQECIRMGYKKNIFWKKHKGQCLEECPAEYMTKEDDVYACKPCDGPCPRVCMPKVVDSVATAQELKGCTIIQGILEIQIRGGNGVGQELEDGLGQIEVVDGYIKIIGSPAIFSLHFFKNLRLIKGNSLHAERWGRIQTCLDQLHKHLPLSSQTYYANPHDTNINHLSVGFISPLPQSFLLYKVEDLHPHLSHSYI